MIRKSAKIRWTARMLRLIGRKSDSEVAVEFGVPWRCVSMMRRRMGIPAIRTYRKPPPALPPAAVALLGKRPDYEIAARFDLPLNRVAAARRELSIPASAKGVGQSATPLPPEAIALLGQRPNYEIAARFNLHHRAVVAKGRELGIRGVPLVPRTTKILRQSPAPLPPEAIALLGQRPDHEIAARFGLSFSAVAAARRKQGIFIHRIGRWTPERIAQLGTMTDEALGAQLGITRAAVHAKRTRMGIPPFRRPSSRRSAQHIPSGNSRSSGRARP